MFAVFVWFFTIVQFGCKFFYNDNGDKEILELCKCMARSVRHK